MLALLSAFSSLYGALKALALNYGTMYFMLSPIHTADADEMKLFCRVSVGGVNTIRDDCRRIRLTILKLTKQTP